MGEPDRSRHARERLARELRGLRERAGLTGLVVARAAGISRSKLSKIETAALLPTTADVQRLAQITGAEPEVAAALLELTRTLHAENEGSRVVLHRGNYRKQQEIARIELDAAVCRAVHLTLIPGLLQTPEYLRTLLSGVTGADVPATVAARMARQQMLAEPSRRFLFVLTESVLRTPRGSPAVMAGQLDRLAAETERPTVRLGVIPWSVSVPVNLLHSFEVFDQQLATIGTHTAHATVRDPVEIAEYLTLFDRLAEIALYDEPVRRLLHHIGAEYRAQA